MKRRMLQGLLLVAILAALPAAAMANGVPAFDFASPLFGLAVAPDGSLLVADTGAGVVELRSGEGGVVAELPGVADIAPIGRGDMFAITSGGSDPTSGKLFRVSRGGTAMLADLAAFEAANDPDGGGVDSNPFDVAVLNGGHALVADAAGNDLLIVDQRGNVDWVATLPMEDVSTDNLIALTGGCPASPFCGLPPMMPAQAVATSVAIGPDGAYYVGELKGFPAPTNASKVWRIEPGTLHADCAVSPACSVVAEGFTSIIDLAFGPDGMLYVVEFDENSFLAFELPFLGLPPAPAGGTVNQCDLSAGTCTEFAAGLLMPTSVAVDRNNQVYATVSALIPGAAQVIMLP